MDSTSQDSLAPHHYFTQALALLTHKLRASGAVRISGAVDQMCRHNDRPCGESMLGGDVTRSGSRLWMKERR